MVREAYIGVVVLLSAGCSASEGGAATGGGASRGAGSGGASGDQQFIDPGSTRNGGVSRDDSCASVAQRPEVARGPADIIWAIDTSGSMTVEAAAVQDNMNRFSQLIVDSGIDAHVVLIADSVRTVEVIPVINIVNGIAICVGPPLGSGAADCNDTNLPNFLHVEVGVGSNDALAKIIETRPQWEHMLRPNASKTFIVVTDDEASGVLSADFTAAFSGDPMFPHWVFSGIFCTQGTGLDCAGHGQQYNALVAQSGGVSGDLATQNFQPVFDALATGVVQSAGFSCDFPIPTPEGGGQINPTQVNVTYSDAAGAHDLYGVSDANRCDPTLGGWYFDNAGAPGRIYLCPQSCATINAGAASALDVLFGCDTKPIPQ